MTTLTISGCSGLRIGDRIRRSGDSNAVWRKIIAASNDSTFETTEGRRPSRGYARHVRRMKQATRRP